jgi:hypothetical protein
MSSSLRGLLASLANIDPSARLRLFVFMIFVERSRPLRAGLLNKDHENKTAASARRSHRGAGEAQRSSRAAA